MNELALGEFGFSGKVFKYRGRVLSQSASGSQLVFLFSETHSDREGILRSVQNAVTLWDLGIVSCVGVEEYPFYFTGWSREAIDSIWASHLAQNQGNQEEGIRHSLKNDYGQSRFGKALKLARPDIPVRSVDDLELCAQVQQILNYAKVMEGNIPSGGGPEASKIATKQLRDDFEQCRANVARDKAFLRNHLDWWRQHDVTKASILNVGKSHQDRIARMLRADIRFIQFDTSETSS